MGPSSGTLVSRGRHCVSVSCVWTVNECVEATGDPDGVRVGRPPHVSAR